MDFCKTRVAGGRSPEEQKIMRNAIVRIIVLVALLASANTLNVSTVKFDGWPCPIGFPCSK